MNPGNPARRSLAVLFLILVLGSALSFIVAREKAREMEVKDAATSREALYYKSLPGNMVQCFLCPSRCVLSSGEWGLCKARKNIRGKLYSMVYGKIAAVHVDPIEKKPFFHVLPGSKAFSIASTGCNIRCLFCQNWEISQAFPGEAPVLYATPEQIVAKALESGSRSIAFTYNEPVINYEFMLETAKLAKSRGLRTVVVSCGYIEEEPLRELLKYIDAYKVDLKAFREEFYHKLTGGRLATVLNSLKIVRQSGLRS
jgi:pyruvate formate lyase activating enzyme